MKWKVTALLLASTLAIATTAALAKPPRGKHHHRYAARVDHRATAFDYYANRQHRTVFDRPDGYWPDHRLCFPGACRDNPHY